MFKKMKGLIYIILLLIGFSLIDSDLDIAASNINYVNEYMESGVYFSNVSTTSGSNVSISSDGRNINFGNIVLNKKGDIETITYEIFNDKSYNDVSVDILINGSKVYEDDTFIIRCSDFGTLKRGSKKSGSITIELKRDVIRDVNLPLNFSISINPIYKNFSLFK